MMSTAMRLNENFVKAFVHYHSTVVCTNAEIEYKMKCELCKYTLSNSVTRNNSFGMKQCNGMLYQACK